MTCHIVLKFLALGSIITLVLANDYGTHPPLQYGSQQSQGQHHYGPGSIARQRSASHQQAQAVVQPRNYFYPDSSKGGPRLPANGFRSPAQLPKSSVETADQRSTFDKSVNEWRQTGHQQQEIVQTEQPFRATTKFNQEQVSQIDEGNHHEQLNQNSKSAQSGPFFSTGPRARGSSVRQQQQQKHPHHRSQHEQQVVSTAEPDFFGQIETNPGSVGRFQSEVTTEPSKASNRPQPPAPAQPPRGDAKRLATRPAQQQQNQREKIAEQKRKDNQLSFWNRQAKNPPQQDNQVQAIDDTFEQKRQVQRQEHQPEQQREQRQEHEQDQQQEQQHEQHQEQRQEHHQEEQEQQHENVDGFGEVGGKRPPVHIVQQFVPAEQPVTSKTIALDQTPVKRRVVKKKVPANRQQQQSNNFQQQAIVDELPQQIELPQTKEEVTQQQEVRLEERPQQQPGYSFEPQRQRPQQQQETQQKQVHGEDQQQQEVRDEQQPIQQQEQHPQPLEQQQQQEEQQQVQEGENLQKQHREQHVARFESKSVILDGDGHTEHQVKREQTRQYNIKSSNPHTAIYTPLAYKPKFITQPRCVCYP